MRLALARDRLGRVALAIGLAVLVAGAGMVVAPGAQAGIIAANQRDGRCVVTASIAGVVPWELRLERRRGGRWVTVSSPAGWGRTRATFRCSSVARARIRVRATASGSPARPVTSAIRQPVPIVPQVRLIYARPKDRPARDDFPAAIGAAAREIQRWYGEQVGRSFRLSPRGVERCVLPRSAAHYVTRSFSRVYDGLQRCRGVSYASPAYVWLVYADVDHGCRRSEPLGTGTPGLAILPRDDLDGLVGVIGTADCGEALFGGPGRWVGGAAHELGHTFGLPHAPGCDDGLPTCDFSALMWAGYVDFPATHLTPGERSRLLRSPFFTRDWASFRG